MKKRHGIPFLLVLGLLLVFSGGFLAVQVWGNPGQSSAAATLVEAPDAPPVISSAPPDAQPAKPLAPPVAPKKIEAPQEPPEIKDEEKIESPAPVAPPKPAPIVKKEEKKVEPETKAPKAEIKQKSIDENFPKSAKPQKPEKAKAGDLPKVEKAPKSVKSPEKVAIASPELKENVTEPGKIKPKKKKSRKRKVAIAQVPTEIPPEWNWFSTPLKVELKGKSVTVVADFAALPMDKVEPLSASTEIVSEPKAAPSFPSAEPVLNSKATELFGNALKRAEITKEKIQKDASSRGVVLPSQGGSTEHVPQTLRRLRDTINYLIQRAEEDPPKITSRAEEPGLKVVINPPDTEEPVSGKSWFSSAYEEAVQAANAPKYTEAFELKLSQTDGISPANQAEDSLD